MYIYRKTILHYYYLHLLISSITNLQMSPSRILSTACTKEAHTFTGSGVIVFSSPALYLPVCTRIPLIPAACAPATSSLTS